MCGLSDNGWLVRGRTGGLSKARAGNSGDDTGRREESEKQASRVRKYLEGVHAPTIGGRTTGARPVPARMWRKRGGCIGG